ncbi:MAG: S8 family peptidase [Myxococcota bacterium]|nr:S8 family peptidase [Myxococcota bacterium]
MKSALQDAASRADERRAEADITVASAEPGLYVQFDSQPGFELQLDSLESKRQGIELVAVTTSAELQRATVFIPRGKVKHFVSRFEDYAAKKTDGGQPKHKPLVESMTGLRLATLKALWTDDPKKYPKAGEAIWFEVWLRKHDGGEVGRLEEFATKMNEQLGDELAAPEMEIRVGSRRLEFDDRIVTLLHATPEQLSASLDVLNDLAEVRRATETAAVFLKMGVTEQGDWVEELKGRTTGPRKDAPAVCILDTGVTRGHPLLEGALAAGDLHAVEPDWGKADHNGHGTEMAGLALYGDLNPVLQTSGPVVLRHRLESVKILAPPHLPQTEPELYGNVTAQGTSLVESQAIRRRCFSMAVTSVDNAEGGEPTSWSAAIDALAAGRSFDETKQGLVFLDAADEDARRLFVVSAGNVEEFEADHLTKSDNTSIFDPAHAWNALTVGACTDLCHLNADDPQWKGWTALAKTGELSPFSSTSVGFDRPWPIKPDVVLEGGNLATNAGKSQFRPADPLSLLTTHFRPAQRLFAASWATSAATAQAARMAAEISAQYPSLWPETIRALIVHSAEWTPQMRGNMTAKTSATAKEALLRRYGFGLADMERALKSAKNALTLIVQDAIQPFANGKYGQIHLHQLPWPSEVLTELGDAEVRLRVTLSYFVEPNPSRLGWKRRHSYASHGLRFRLLPSGLSMPEFSKQLNKLALDEGERKPTTEETKGWTFGATAQTKGSLHGNTWEGTAAELALRGGIGVYPVAGWWKEQPKRDRSEHGARYALIVSIETEAENADIWSPVATEVGIPVTAET